MKNGTIKEFAVMLNVDYNTAFGLLRFLEIKKIAQRTQSPATSGKKGKPSSIYTIPDEVTIKFNK